MNLNLNISPALVERIAAALERIAACAEVLAPPLVPLPDARSLIKDDEDALTYIDNEKAAEFEEEDARAALSGLSIEEREQLRKELERGF